MPLSPRGNRFTGIAIGAPRGADRSRARAAKNFPNKPVRFVTTGPGSQNDLVAGLITAKLTETWGQPVVIEDRTFRGVSTSS